MSTFRQIAIDVIRALADRCGVAVLPSPRGWTSGIDLWRDLAIWTPNARLIIDVGANTGQTIRQARQRWPQADIVSFEPSPETFSRLRQTYGRDTKVRLECIALSDRTDTARLHLTRDGYTVNHSLNVPTWDTNSPTVDVPLDTLDHYCDGRGIHSIDVLKIDTQGHDLRVLQGARGLLSSRRCDFVLAEVMFVPQYVEQPSLEALLEFGREMGYSLCGLYEQMHWRNKLVNANLCWRRPSVAG